MNGHNFLMLLFWGGATFGVMLTVSQKVVDMQLEKLLKDKDKKYRREIQSLKSRHSTYEQHLDKLVRLLQPVNHAKECVERERDIFQKHFLEDCEETII